MLLSASGMSNRDPQPIPVDCNGTAAQQSDCGNRNKCISQCLHHPESSHLSMPLRTCCRVWQQLLPLSYHPILLPRRSRRIGGVGATSNLAQGSSGDLGAARARRCRRQSRYPCFTPLIMTLSVLGAVFLANSILCEYIYFKIQEFFHLRTSLIIV